MQAVSRLTQQSRTNRATSTLPEMLASIVRERPDEPAVISGENMLTFRELQQRAVAVAALVTPLGIGADDAVGIFAEPGLDLPVLIWGALYSGAAYLPLAPDYPDERLRYMIENSQAKVILAEHHLAARMRDIAPEGTHILTPEHRGSDELPLMTHARANDLAYLIYTSGSTGRPKGVMIEHRSIVSQLQWLADAGHLGNGVRILQKTPTSFDAAQWEVLAPATGATTVMGVSEIHRNPYIMTELIGRHSVTALQCVPTMLQALLDTEGFEACSSLTHVYSGGEALATQLAAQFLTALPWCSLTNLYGPSECTINALSHKVTPDDTSSDGASVPIGRPVAGTECLLLDGNLAPVQDGAMGELYVSGVQVSRGYLNSPDQTSARFIPSPFSTEAVLYRTGDLAACNDDGTFQFMGRIDNQVKLRGYRVELEEIALTVEQHPWVRRAAVVVAENKRTGNPELVACVEMNPNEAALMDQGNHGGHHQSKSNKLQVKAQLSDPGVRSDLPGDAATRVLLPGRAPSAAVRAAAFARKSYRFYEGGPVSREELEEFLRNTTTVPGPMHPKTDGAVTELGEELRWIGQFISEERLLPKYSFASPGALYAVQTYLDINDVTGVADGLYYYHPVSHDLYLIGSAAESGAVGPSVRIHLIGKHGAIEPVYRNNILEVLEFEAGHLLGALQDATAQHGRSIQPLGFDASHKDRCQVGPDDHYLGSFAITDGNANLFPESELFINIPGNKVAGLPPGTYAWDGTALSFMADGVIQAKHVIAINQRIFDRSSFGITAVSRSGPTWLKYISLGCLLHRAQRNGLASGLGFMSAGYSSRTGNPLPAAWRIADILATAGREPGASYFFVGGKVSPSQISSEGMYEDSTHMQGPAEMIKEELSQILPDYMVPHRTVVFDELPLTPNGKIDCKALAVAERVTSLQSDTPFVAPSTQTEKRLAGEWGELLKYDDVSMEDEFFAVGGNSLMSVTLISRIGKVFGLKLPLRSLIDTPKLMDLARLIEDGQDSSATSSRFISLGNATGQRPVYCWPGLGGYPMNLMQLASAAVPMRPFYGIQSHGINAGEEPFATIREMAAADIAEMRAIQPQGPYTLWGYSFGARVAFEAAWQLEQIGENVDRLMLICPGNPGIRETYGDQSASTASFTDPAFVAVLCSVFTGTSTGSLVQQCIAETSSKTTFMEFIGKHIRALDPETIERIANIVMQTYEFEYTFKELAARQLNAPICIFKAAGDNYSFIETADSFAEREPEIVSLSADHYEVLREQRVDELANALRRLTYAAIDSDSTVPA